jgi:hypothetical protein
MVIRNLGIGYADCFEIRMPGVVRWRWSTVWVGTTWSYRIFLYRGSDGILCHAYHTAWFNFNEINLIEEIVNARTDSYARARRHVM